MANEDIKKFIEQAEQVLNGYDDLNQEIRKAAQNASDTSKGLLEDSLAQTEPFIRELREQLDVIKRSLGL